MSKRVLRPDSFALTWLSVLLIVFGSLSWLPAAAQDATPGDIPAVETAAVLEPAVIEPTELPATEPPTSVPTDPPTQAIATEEATAEPPAARTSLITPLAAPQVTGITLTCAVRGIVIDGVVSVSDPDASTIDLRLVTTDVPAIDTLQNIGVDLEPGQTNYTFEAELDPDDYPASTTKEVVVTGPDGTPVSEPIGIEQDGGGSTVCTPAGSTSPTEPTVTEPGGTSTATATATSTTAPVSSVGRVSNTGSSNLNCRAQPSTNSSIIARLPAGANVEVRGAATGGWVPVRCANQDGWVSADYLVVTTAPTATATPVSTATATTTPAPGTTTYGTVSNTGGSNLRCRTAPNTSASIITLLPSGMRVEARGAAVNGWLPVRCGGQDGWVSASYMVVSTGSATPTATVTPT
ncbi:MAG: SH3 domain-containing protein, partial [Chloroflexota bacterium]|nr:SH3 domain-containing protein [Chloroflexota bacterium]